MDRGEPADHTWQLPRLRRIEGQVRGLQQMIEVQRHCIDVAYQIEAVIAALRRVEADMLRDHLKAQVQTVLCGNISEDEHKSIVDEITRIIAKNGR